jgi:hypothetical protein
MLKRFFASIVLVISLGLVATPLAYAQDESPEADGFFNDSTIEILKSFQDESGFNTFTGNNSPVEGEGNNGIDNITGALNTIIRLVQYVAGGLAVLFLVLTLIQMIASPADKSEEEYNTLKKYLLYIVIGVVIIMSAEVIFRQVLNTAGSGFLSDGNAAQDAAAAGNDLIRGIYNFIQAIVGTIAVVMLVIAGFNLVSNASNEERLDQAKKQIIYACLGLVLIGISELVVKDIIFRDAGTTIGVESGKQLLVQLTNFISGFIATASVLSFFYAGYLYIFSGVGEDNTEKVKKVIIGAVIGIIIAGGAFGIVNTFVELDASRAPEVLTEQLDRAN